MRRVHMGATDVICKKETPRRHIIRIAIEEALMTDQVCSYLPGDLLNDDFCTQRTISIGYTCAIRVKPRRI